MVAALGTALALLYQLARAKPSGQTAGGTKGDSLLIYACVMLLRLKNHRSMTHIGVLCKLMALDLLDSCCMTFADTFI